MVRVLEINRFRRYGDRNALIDYLWQQRKDPSFLFFQPEIADIIRPWLDPKAWESRTISAASRRRLAGLKLFTGPDARLAENPPGPPPGVIGRLVLPLVLSDTGHACDLLVEKAGGIQRPDRLLERAAALLQDYWLHSGRPSFYLNPADYVVSFLFGLGAADNRPAPSVDGESYGLGLLLALFSRLCERPLPADLAASAALADDGSLLPVAGLELKAAALRRERPYVTRLLVAAGQPLSPTLAGLECLPYADVFSCLQAFFPPSEVDIPLPFDVDKCLDLIRQQYKDYQLANCLANATSLLTDAGAAGRPRALFEAYSFRGSVYCHQGRIDESRADFVAAQDLYEQDQDVIGKTLYGEMRNRRAVALKDVFAYDEAEKIHLDNHKDFEVIGADLLTRVRNLSSLSQLYTAQGRFDEALEFQQMALEMLARAGEDQTRNRGYLVDLFTRSEDYEAAAGALRQAREACNGRSAAGRKTGGGDEVFLDWYEAQLLYREMVGREEKRPAGLARLKTLRDQYPDYAFHAPALVHKFAGLGELLMGEAGAWEKLEELVQFFSREEQPTYQLLAASLRCDRLLLKLTAAGPAFEIGQTVAAELEEIVRLLRLQPETVAFFNDSINDLVLLISRIQAAGSSPGRDEFCPILSYLLSRIPY